MSARGQLIEAALKAGHRVRVRAAGSSMRPLVPSGARITVEPNGGPVRVDDVVVALADGELVAHRVTRVDPVELRGDSSTAVEHAPEILGRVVAVEWRGVGYRIDAGWGRLWSRACARVGPWLRRAEKLL